MLKGINHDKDMTLKAKLMILLIIMVIPFVGYSAFRAFEINGRLQEDIRSSNLATAKSISREATEYIAATENILIAIASNPDIREGDFSKARLWFDAMLKSYPLYHLFIYVDAKGDIKVSSISRAWAKSAEVQEYWLNSNVSEDECYKRGIAANGIAVGDFSYDKATGIPIVHFLYPVFDHAGKRAGFVATALDLGKMQGKLLEASRGGPRVVTIFNSDGTILARVPEPKRFVGKSYAQQKSFQEMIGKTAGTAKVKMPDSGVRICAFSKVENAPWFVRVGVDESYVYKQISTEIIKHFQVFFPLLLIALFGWLWIGRNVRTLHMQTEQTERLSLTDSLTGLWNSRGLQADLEREITRAQRYDEPLSFLMLDVDHFKHYNDHNGHQVGDNALKLIANIVRYEVRDTDYAYRYGGEELCVLLPNTDKHGALAAAERIRSDVERADFAGEMAQPLGKLTISIGSATFPCDATAKQSLIKNADIALYRAKDKGRNKVEVFYCEHEQDSLLHA